MNRPIASVGFVQFLLYFMPVVLTSAVMWCEARRWFQPAGLRLSWRGIVLQIARWPVVLWALVNVVLRVKRPYMVTPKGKATGTGPRPFTIYGPYVILTAFPLLALWIPYATGGASVTGGYYALVLANAVMGAMVLVTTVGMDIKEIAKRNGVSLAALRGRAGIILALICLLALLTVTLAAFGHQAIHALHTAQPRT